MKGKATILLIDDDVDFIEMNKAVLEHHGYHVVTAFSAVEGREKVREERPDLIVLDLMMEKHDSGFTLAKDLKRDHRSARIPILMLTSVAEATGYRFSQGDDGYWMKTDEFRDKPISPNELLERVEVLLARASRGDPE
jgi:DNA-binding response OmpR family regulator